MTDLKKQMDEWAREAEDQYAKSPRERSLFPDENQYIRVYQRTKYRQHYGHDLIPERIKTDRLEDQIR